MKFINILLAAVAAKRGVMPWLCLEICHETSQNITSNLNQIEMNKDLISYVSFERYGLGSNSTLNLYNLTDVNPIIQKMGLKTTPMIISVDINNMRQVFENPQPFFDSVKAETEKNGYSGWNIDWEPSDPSISDADGLNYAKFLDAFSLFT